jgi:surfeit locus 1 family protein
VSRPTAFFAVFAVAISLGCVRLGFWQVSRLRERQARNAAVLGRLRLPPVPVADLPGDSGARFRRTAAAGRYDYAHELVLAFRSRNGSPGVHLLTPMRLEGSDHAVLVNRGWVYAADGMRTDVARWRERESARVEGFAELFASGPGAVSTPSFERAIRRLDRDSIRARVPYALLPVIIVQQLDSGLAAAAAADIPVRAEPPPLSEGSHRAYAVQWFAFAAVGFAGTMLVVRRDRRRTGGGASGEGDMAREPALSPRAG